MVADYQGGGHQGGMKASPRFQRGMLMDVFRRKFLHLAASAATLPAVPRFARATNSISISSGTSRRSRSSAASPTWWRIHRFHLARFPEFIAYAKGNLGQISMASGGIGTVGHLSGGVDLVHVLIADCRPR